MASQISWLDASADEHRRVREIVQLFSQRETQDELGGRRIVVTLSDALFPGTSVLHSRARYLLFVPWFAQMAAPKKDGPGWLDWYERQMIQAFLDDDTVDDADRLAGLIGREAGPTVKQLPSTVEGALLSEPTAQLVESFAGPVQPLALDRRQSVVPGRRDQRIADAAQFVEQSLVLLTMEAERLPCIGDHGLEMLRLTRAHVRNSEVLPLGEVVLCDDEQPDRLDNEVLIEQLYHVVRPSPGAPSALRLEQLTADVDPKCLDVFHDGRPETGHARPVGRADLPVRIDPPDQRCERAVVAECGSEALGADEPGDLIDLSLHPLDRRLDFLDGDP